MTRFSPGFIFPAPDRVFTSTFLGNARIAVTGNPHNYLNSSFGSAPNAGQDRYIVVHGGSGSAAGGGSIASVLIGGVTGVALVNTGIVVRSASIWISQFPINTGASGTIAVTKNTGSTNQTGISWYALYCPAGSVISVPEAYAPAAAASYSKSLATGVGGITYALDNNSADSFNYSGDTPDYDAIGGGAFFISGFGKIDTGTTHALSLAPTGVTNRFVAASLLPLPP